MSQKLLSMSLRAAVPKSQVVECYPSVIEKHQYYKGGDHQESNNPTASGGWPKHEHGSKAISLQMPFQNFTAWQMTFLIFLLHFFLFFFFFLIIIYLLFIFGCTVGLHCFVWAFSSWGKRRLLFVAVHRLLLAVASPVAEHGL